MPVLGLLAATRRRSRFQGSTREGSFPDKWSRWATEGRTRSSEREQGVVSVTSGKDAHRLHRHEFEVMVPLRLAQGHPATLAVAIGQVEPTDQRAVVEAWVAAGAGR